MAIGISDDEEKNLTVLSGNITYTKCQQGVYKWTVQTQTEVRILQLQEAKICWLSVIIGVSEISK